MAVVIRQVHPLANDEPMFVISVAARLVEMHPQTLRYYERAGLVKPKRSRGKIRLYSQTDVERLKKIARLVDDLGVNLAGVEVILNLTAKLELMQQVLEENQIALPDTLEKNDALNVDPPPEDVPEPSEPAPQSVQLVVRRPRALTKTTETSKSKRSNHNG